MIYFDNAATSFPKPKSVVRAVQELIASPLGNPGRSGHKLSLAADRIVYEARETLASVLGLDKPENIIFTAGCTASLNTAILGTVQALEKRREKPLCATSVLEHNAVLRPLYALEKMGRITLRILPVDENGKTDLAVLPRTPDLVCLTMRSNVTGRAVARTAVSFFKEKGSVILMDAAQFLGHDAETPFAYGADIVCAPGHKGLMGIMGGGFLAVSDTCPILPEAVFSGGSGNASFSPAMPDDLPERLEAGTLPVPAIAAMKEGALFCRSVGFETIASHEKELKQLLLEGIDAIPNLVLYDKHIPTGPLLFNHRTVPSADFCRRMEQEGLLARGGFHCAPLTHRLLGTEKTGGVRLSPGFFNTKKEVQSALAILNRLAKG